MGGKGSGPKKGYRQAGSIVSQLHRAGVGGTIWTEQPQQSVVTTASRAGITVTSEQWYAIHTTTQRMVPITRLTVVQIQGIETE